MILRDRQEVFVGRFIDALKTHGSTLGIAPTGAGKTIMLSAIAGRMGGSNLILQHRDELVEQNEQKFRKVNPKIKTSFVVADYKRWVRGAGATFAMIQTLAREKNLADMPPVDRIIVDEGHHAVSDSYLKVIDHAKKLNPDVQIGLVTATPRRGDRRTLRALVDNVADQITLNELIQAGLLVKPRALVIDTGTEGELDALPKKTFDDLQVEKILNKRVINDKVVEKWKELASDRRTVVFASTVQHARDVADAFIAAGVDARVVYGDMPDWERTQMLADFDAGKFPVVVNVAVLTEGWDCQPVSCVILLRRESDLSILIQMVGRGLRIVDPELYPGIHKNDCLVMDFGYSIAKHRGLEQNFRIGANEGAKACPECEAEIPKCLHECPICGYEWPRTVADKVKDSLAGGEGPNALGVLEHFVMTEVDLFEQSPYRWENLFDGLVTIANAIDAWACVLNIGGQWVAVGGAKEEGIRLLGDNEDRLLSLAVADDFLREHGDDDTAKKSKSWLNQPPSEKQLQLLGLGPMGGLGMSRYRASCLLTWKFFERGIKQKVTNRGLRKAA